MTDEVQVQELMRHVEAHLFILPPKTRSAVEVVLHDAELTSYAVIAERLAQREGRQVSPVAVRQRLSRGARLLEAVVRARQSR